MRCLWLCVTEERSPQHLTVPESDGPVTFSASSTPSPTRKAGRPRTSLPEGTAAPVVIVHLIVNFVPSGRPRTSLPESTAALDW